MYGKVGCVKLSGNMHREQMRKRKIRRWQVDDVEGLVRSEPMKEEK